ncbi:PQQ-dependent sugar dehydrogenase [Maribacter hydrothermalis]|uniref:PQQ-dependent sugar dehydrogenase n=1 Tax=Maribacter hydrothermalis TaxID=1836467 RepID=UPI0018D47B90|nr:PQQ-dependent sugar dehydrogenase [Maribacter hydrothermalis]
MFIFKYAVSHTNSHDRYFNGVFPPQSPSEVPYGIAFPSLKFDTPLTFNTIPHQNKLVVGQRDGKIYWFENDQKTTDKNLLADLSDEVGVVWDGGFLGLTIHPNFGTTGKNYFYVFYSSEDSNNKDFPDFYSTLGCDTEEFWGNYLVLERFEVNPITLKLKTGSRNLLLKLRMYGTTHRGGGLQFGNDGFLYLATADQTARVKSQDIKNNLDGGVLRLDVDKDPEKSHRPIRKIQKHGYEDEISGLEYWIPNDNPFLSPDGTNYEEYYTLGHRNPHRMTKDRESGLFYIGEIGEDTHEEINVIQKGKNYGWPIFEGDEPGPNCGIKMYNDMPHEYPLVSFPRTDANCIIGGFVYRGDKIPNLYGKYICADYGNGEEMWSVDIKTGDYTLLGNFAPADIVSFGEDAQGNIYILKQGEDVNLYTIMPSTISYEGFPKNITETNIFKNLQTLEVSDDLTPYNLIESSWSDGAYKKRWMFIPNTGTNENEAEKISFSENEEWEFPIGSVLIAHLDLPIDDKNPQLTKKIETRFSIKGHDGKFYFLTYNWNDEQTEATLQKESIDEQVAIKTKDFGVRYQNWHFPSNTECIVCHNGASKGSLGFRTKNLNMEFPHNNTKINQLVNLSDKGIINKIITDNDTESLPTHKPLNDDTATLNDRARSYLDLNCGYCHRPDTGNRAEFDLRLFNSLEETGLLNAGTLTPLGIDGERILVPGNAEKSILFQRMLSTETTTMMPPLAKGVVDEDAVILIRDWINQLQISIN